MSLPTVPLNDSCNHQPCISADHFAVAVISVRVISRTGPTPLQLQLPVIALASWASSGAGPRGAVFGSFSVRVLSATARPASTASRLEIFSTLNIDFTSSAYARHGRGQAP